MNFREKSQEAYAFIREAIRIGPLPFLSLYIRYKLNQRGLYTSLLQAGIGLSIYIAGLFMILLPIYAPQVAFASELSIWIVSASALAGLVIIRVGAMISQNAVDRRDEIEQQRQGENQE